MDKVTITVHTSHITFTSRQRTSMRRVQWTIQAPIVLHHCNVSLQRTLRPGETPDRALADIWLW